MLCLGVWCSTIGYSSMWAHNELDICKLHERITTFLLSCCRFLVFGNKSAASAAPLDYIKFQFSNQVGYYGASSARRIKCIVYSIWGHDLLYTTSSSQFDEIQPFFC